MARTQGGKDFWVAALRADGPAFRTAVAGMALDAPVPSCPEWTVQDLVHHLGAVYQWVRGHAARGVTSVPEPRWPQRADRPTGPAALTWWDGEFAQLMELLDGLDPELAAWNWAPQAKKAGFLHRRMAHETAVHRWDAQMAGGLAEPVEAKLAADGVSEVLDSWLPAGRRRGPTDRVGVVQLTAVDAGQDWSLRLRADGGVALLDTRTLLDADSHGVRAAGTGNASDLLLALWGRVQFDVLQVTGDKSLLDSLRTG
jgi:uncharacterized protein (TIGR03083 family)